LSEAFEDNVEQLLYSFLAVMTTNNHLNEFFTAAKEFEKMYEDYRKMSFAVITSAVKLTDEEKRKIVTRLRKVTGKAVYPVYKIDASIIGGITVTCDGKFFDGSVVRNLKNIKEAIS
jgi:F-type H+-transporting ATPase subunit delta